MAETQVLLTDLIIGESPRWPDGRSWFCNRGAREIIAADLGGGREVIAIDPVRSSRSRPPLRRGLAVRT
jgi:sugar lactone lactonase YvrE